MILKSSRRAGSLRDARELLRHLLHDAENTSITEVTGINSIADLIDDARTFVAGEAREALWHLSVNPALPLTAEQWARTERVVRDSYRLSDDMPLAVVEHSKPHRPRIGSLPRARPAHRHFLFPTRDPASSRIISPFRHYVVNERISRQLEHEFSHPLVKGRHNRAVARFALLNQMRGLAAAMEAADLLDGAAPVQAVSNAERAAATRLGSNAFAPVDASAAALAIAEAAPIPLRGPAYLRALADQGYILARGRRLVLVPLNGGNPSGAAKKARMTEAALRQLLGTELKRLPTLAKGADMVSWPEKQQVLAEPSNPYGPGVILSGHRAIIRCADFAEDPEEVAAWRERWLASALRGDYDSSWLPMALFDDLGAIDVLPADAAVVLTLRSGTRLFDRLDRLDVVGTAGDVTAAHLAEAVEHRGWNAVMARGTHAFRHAFSEQLAALDYPVAIRAVQPTRKMPSATERLAEVAGPSAPRML